MTTPFDGKDITVTINKDYPATHWNADISIALPSYIDKGDSIHVEIGFNDKDKSKTRDHQLVWSSFKSEVTPWQNVNQIGTFVLTGELANDSPSLWIKIKCFFINAWYKVVNLFKF